MQYIVRLATTLLILGTLVLPALADSHITPKPTEVKAGLFRMDPAHTRVMFSVSHLGFSNYTAFFTKADATLNFDPENPAAMQLTATVDPASVETLYPDPSFDFNALIEGAEFLDAAQFPEMTFTSTAIALTAPDTADVTGDMTLHGVTKPVTLQVRFNGGYQGHPLDPGGARIGFSAEGVLKRSDFGVSFGIPVPPDTIGVSDEVTVRIETEFMNPDAQGPEAGP